MLLCRRRCIHLQMNAAAVTLSVWWEEGGGEGRVAAAPRCPNGVHISSVPAGPRCRQQKALGPACNQLMLLQTSHSTHRDGPIAGQGHSQSMQMYAVLAAVLLLLRAKTCRLVRDLGPRTIGLLAARNGCTLSEEETILALAAQMIHASKVLVRSPRARQRQNCRIRRAVVVWPTTVSSCSFLLQLGSNTKTAWQQLWQKSIY